MAIPKAQCHHPAVTIAIPTIDIPIIIPIFIIITIIIITY
jgi:hypothetical protein